MIWVSQLRQRYRLLSDRQEFLPTRCQWGISETSYFIKIVRHEGTGAHARLIAKIKVGRSAELPGLIPLDEIPTVLQQHFIGLIASGTVVLTFPIRRDGPRRRPGESLIVQNSPFVYLKS